jgi:cytochrome bd ubiquinol oxidase subunit I
VEVLDLARWQFGITTVYHFLMVPLTIGLSLLVACMQTAWVRTGDRRYYAMTKFWGKLLLINFAMGVVTGIVQEFQFGMTWSAYSRFVGDVFGAPLAMEGLVAFFVESTFLGLWIFGWGRLNRWAHLTLIWLVTITAYASAFWIMVANGFLQHPVGYEEHDGVLRLVDLGALLTNPTFTAAFLHVVGAALTVGGVFVVGVSAFHFIRRTPEVEFFRLSLRLGVVTTALASPFLVGAGIAQFPIINALQPGKMKSMPGLGTPLSFMMLIGVVLLLASWITLPLLARDWVVRMRFPLYLMVFAIPLPFIAAIGGWVVREVGRQPWLVYGLLRTDDAMSPVSATEMLISFLAFTGVFAALAVADWVLISRIARRGPEPETAPQPVSALAPAL